MFCVLHYVVGICKKLDILCCADMAQLAEQLICNQQVIGSSPIIGFDYHKYFIMVICIIGLWGNSRVAKGDRL